MLTNETYRLEVENTKLGNVHGEAVHAVKVTLLAVTKQRYTNGSHAGNSYRFVDEATIEVDGSNHPYFSARRNAAIAKAVRSIRIHTMLKRDARRETQAAFMAAVAS